MINGNMCVGPCKGSLIVRLNREKNDEIQLEPHAKPMGIMRELMRGWAKIEPTGIASDDELKTRVGRAAKFARSLPPE